VNHLTHSSSSQFEQFVPIAKCKIDDPTVPISRIPLFMFRWMKLFPEVCFLCPSFPNNILFVILPLSWPASSYQAMGNSTSSQLGSSQGPAGLSPKITYRDPFSKADHLFSFSAHEMTKRRHLLWPLTRRPPHHLQPPIYAITMFKQAVYPPSAPYRNAPLFLTSDSVKFPQ